MRVLPLLVALPMFAACGGDDGNVVSVFPESGFVGRTTTVEITGVDTSFGLGSTVDFGEGVTIDAVTVISGNALQVDLSIAPEAEPGFTDVSVDGSTIVGAFELLNPLEVAEGAALDQGGFGSITITNLDLLHPFDLTTDEETGEFINLNVTSTNDGVLLQISDATTTSITLSALVDVNATETGDITINASDGTTPNVTILPSLSVNARTPTVLTANSVLADVVLEPSGTLFEITAAEFAMLQLRLDSPDGLFPSIDVLPASGKWSEELVFQSAFFDVLVFDNRVVQANEKLYVVVADISDTATLTTRTISLNGVTPVADTGTNDTAATAQTGATGTIVQYNGTLTSQTDKDCFDITTTVANQKIHVFTTGEDGLSDTQIKIFDVNDTTILATSADALSGDDVVTAALVAPAVARAVCISSQIQTFTNMPYKAFVVIEP